jgi:hypothetical protein
LKGFFGGECEGIGLESHPMGFKGQTNHESSEDVDEILLLERSLEGCTLAKDSPFGVFLMG